MTKFYKVDATAFSVVGLCLNPACDYRVLGFSKETVWEDLRRHEQEVHPNTDRARRGLKRAQRPLEKYAAGPR